MDKLLKTLDESVFTPELTSKIQELYESKINAIESDYEEKLQLVESKASTYAEYVQEEMEAKASEYAEYVKEELTNTLGSYLDVVVEEFVAENTIAIDNAVQTSKMKAVLEGFDSLLVTTGVSLSQIVEAKDENSSVSEIEKLNKTLDKVIKENADLKAQLNDKIVESTIAKVSADMNLAQKDMFEKLSEMVIFTGNVDAYEAKLATIVETVHGKKDELNENFRKPLDRLDETDVKTSHKRFF
jgi:hypothetical protein